MAIKSNTGKSTLYRSYVQEVNFPIPQTVFTDASGTEIGRIVGYKPPAEFYADMESILAEHVS